MSVDCIDKIFLKSLEQLLIDYSLHDRPVYRSDRVRDILKLTTEEMATFSKKMEEAGLIRISDVKAVNCSKCTGRAIVRDREKGICTCDNGHRTDTNPACLIQIQLNVMAISRLIKEQFMSTHTVDSKEEDAKLYRSCGYEFICNTTFDDLHANLIIGFQKLDLKQATILVGLHATTKSELLVAFTPDMENDAAEYLSFTTNGTIQPFAFQNILTNSEQVFSELKAITNGATGKAIRLTKYFETKLHPISDQHSLEVYKKVIEHNKQLIVDSQEAATTGKRELFEDCVANLLGSILPLTQLGHKTIDSTKKIREVPDGVVFFPNDKQIDLVFYDAKSIGTERLPKENKSISQSEEDEFVRYSKLFRGIETGLNILGGCFVANDFSVENMKNKVSQIRTRERDTLIIFLPLNSLIKLYERATIERQQFLKRFKPYMHFSKILGACLNDKEIDILSKDPLFESFMQIQKVGGNAVYIIPSLVDIFFDNVLRSTSLDNSFMPFLRERSEYFSRLT